MRKVIRTDEHYTPRPVMDTVKRYAYKHGYLRKNDFIIRPFYKGGDYTKEDYTNRIVFDNPPFSIMKDIVNYYCENNIKFFLFINGLTTFSAFNYNHCKNKITAIIVHDSIVYSRGTPVQTSFITNIDPYEHDRLCKKRSVILSPELDNELRIVSGKEPRAKNTNSTLVPSDLSNKIFNSAQLKKYVISMNYYDNIYFDAGNEVYPNTENGKRRFGSGVKLNPSVR